MAGRDDEVYALLFSTGDADDDERNLTRHLKYPAATDDDPTAFRKEVTDTLRYLNGELQDWRLPIRLTCGTPFQQRVWQAILAIPYGETRSYAEIARAAGQPRAFRAAAQACGANPVCLYIPCHRVVQSDGGLGGYGGGQAMLDKKRYLLEMERRQLARLRVA